MKGKPQVALSRFRGWEFILATEAKRRADQAEARRFGRGGSRGRREISPQGDQRSKPNPGSVSQHSATPHPPPVDSKVTKNAGLPADYRAGALKPPDHVVGDDLARAPKMLEEKNLQRRGQAGHATHWAAENGHIQARTLRKVTYHLGELKGHDNFVKSVAFSPDGTAIAYGSWDGSVRIWDAATGRQLRELKGHGRMVTSVAFSPDGTSIASGLCDASVRIWDAATGKQLRPLEGPGREVKSVAFSPDGTTIASGSADQSVRVWDAAVR